MSENLVEVGVGTDSSTTEIRAFGGSVAVAISEEHKKELIERQQKLEASLVDLKVAEKKMWRRLHDGALDSDRLFAEVEKRARSSTPSEQDTKDYQVLRELRAAQEEQAQIVAATTSDDWKTVDLPLTLATLTIDSSIDRSRFWVVVVGINGYHTLQHLNGACPDAIAMYDYFTKTLQVPSENVRLLLSPSPGVEYPHLNYSNPTRSNILDALYDHLRDNPKVQKGDNVVFYYAGHGARYSTSTLFGNTEDTLEALCPADRGAAVGNGTVLDISDRELAIFLEELYTEKGGSVTVILDCCHSGGATRDALAPSLENVRAANVLAHVLPKELLEAADDDPRRKRGSRVAYDKDWKWAQDNCMLIAACLRHELAKEKQFGATKETSNGYFTRALLAVLTSQEGVGKTYIEVCEAVTRYMPKLNGVCIQHPLVVGLQGDSQFWFATKDSFLRRMQKPFLSFKSR